MPPPKRPNTRPNKALVPTSRAKSQRSTVTSCCAYSKSQANTKEREKPEVKQPPAKKRRRGRKRGPPGGWYDPLSNRLEITEEPNSSEDEPMRNRIARRKARLFDRGKSEMLRIAARNDRNGARRKARAKAEVCVRAC